MGTELDRRRPFFVATLTRSPWVGRSASDTGIGLGLAASPSALRVALTTCVASVAFSRIDKTLSARTYVDFARFDAVLATVFGFDRVGFAAADASSLRSSRLLSKAKVVGEQVATDETALRTASPWASGVSMKMSNGLILNHIMAES
jgi:hypothetical protein